MIRAFRTGTLTTGGICVASLPMIRLHGWNLSEAGTAAGIVEFRTHDLANGNGLGTPVIPVIGDDLLFSRHIADAGDDSPWFDHKGVELPGGLFIDLKTGTAVISGVIWYS